jgi:phage terminase large subunit-like protein
MRTLRTQPERPHPRHAVGQSTVPAGNGSRRKQGGKQTGRSRKVRADVARPAAGDFAERATRWARDVVAGEILAGKFVKAACQRHLDDLARSEREAKWPYRFDRDKAARICEFKELLPHIKGDWAKPQLHDGRVVYPKIKLEDWQVFCNALLFGWVLKDSGLRRFRRGYIEVGRKNTKSTDLAGTGLYLLAADGEQGAEVYTFATKKDQAKIVWEVAREMVRREPEFKTLGIGFNQSRIYNALSAGLFQPLARDYGSLDGLNTSGFIGDELHAQKDRRLYDVLDSSTGARSQPLGVGITTAGTDRSGVCYAQRSYVIKLLNAVLHRHEGMGFKVKGGRAEDETYFGIIFTLDVEYADGRDDDEWSDERFWAKANPMLQATHNAQYAKTLLEDLRASAQKARTMPSEQSEFRTKRCSQWLGADIAWMDMVAYGKCGDSALREEQFKGADCVVALDAAFKTDLFAKVKVIEKGGVYNVFCRFYAPRRLIEMKGNEHLQSWANEGLIEVTDGPVVDIEAVRDGLRADAALQVVKEVPFDPAQLTQFAGEMLEEGFQMVEIRPTVLNFSEPMKRIEELVLNGADPKRRPGTPYLRHDGNPVLEWMMSNVVCHRDHKDNIYPNKEKPENKIDGVVSLCMALARLQVKPESTVITQGFVEV